MSRVRPVREVPAWSIGGGGRLRELVVLPPWLVLAFRAAVWLLHRPVLLASIVFCVTAGLYFRSVWAALAAAVLLPIGMAVAGIALLGRRGSASGLRAILVGVSRWWQVRRRWPAVATEIGAVSRAGHVAPLTGLRLTHSGVEGIVVTGQMATHARQLAKKADDIAAGMFCDRVSATVVSPSAVRFSWEWGHHLRRTYRLADLAPPSDPRRVPIGVCADGSSAELVYNLSTLVGGTSGSGKSSLAWAYLAGLLTAQIPFRVRVVDPSGVEFAELGRRVGRSPIAWQYEHDTRRFENMWDQIDRALSTRLAAVTATGVREHVPTAEEPLDVLIIDELLPIAKQLRGDPTGHVVGRIAYLGRKAGFVCLALTQAGQVDVLGRVRDLFPQRISLRTLNRYLTDAVLGDGAESAGARCSELDVIADRGIGYLAAPGVKGFHDFRAAWVPDTETSHIAGGHIPATASRDDLAAEPTSVYGLWDSNGALLYIGIAVAGREEDRWAEHHRRQPWAAHIDRCAVIDTYPNRPLAETAEALAIRQHHPRHNQQHNTSNSHRLYVPSQRVNPERRKAGTTS